MIWAAIVMGWLGGCLVMNLFMMGCGRQDETAEHVKQPSRLTFE